MDDWTSVHFNRVDDSSDGSWEIKAYSNAKEKLEAAGIPVGQPIDTTLKDLAQTVATVKGCSPQLRQDQIQYDFGTTNIILFNHGPWGWCWRMPAAYQPSSPAWSVQRRTIAYMNQHYSQTRFSTRSALHAAFIEAYRAATAHPLVRFKRQVVQEVRMTRRSDRV